MRNLKNILCILLMTFSCLIGLYAMKRKPLLLAPSAKQIKKAKFEPTKEEKREGFEQLMTVHDVKQEDQKIGLESKHAVRLEDEIPSDLDHLSLQELHQIMRIQEEKREKQRQRRLRLMDQKNFVYSLWPDHKQLGIIQEEIKALYAAWSTQAKELTSTVVLPKNLVLFNFFHQLLAIMCKKVFDGMQVPQKIWIYVQRKGSSFPPNIWDAFDQGPYGFKAFPEDNELIIGFSNLIELFFCDTEGWQTKLQRLVFILGHELGHIFLRDQNLNGRKSRLMSCFPKSIQEAHDRRLEEFECDKYGVRVCYCLFSDVDLREIDFLYFSTRHCYEYVQLLEKRLALYREVLKQPYKSFSLRKRIEYMLGSYNVRGLLNLYNQSNKAGCSYFKNNYLDRMAIFLMRDTHPSNRERIQHMKEYLKQLEQ